MQQVIQTVIKSHENGETNQDSQCFFVPLDLLRPFEAALILSWKHFTGFTLSAKENLRCI